MGIQPRLKTDNDRVSGRSEIKLYCPGAGFARAMGTGLLGAALTTIAVYWIDRWLVWKRSIRSESVGPMPASQSVRGPGPNEHELQFEAGNAMPKRINPG